mgnify:FL=1
MKIVKFEPRYRDDLIFMILEAKNALGRVPGINEDLLDIEKNYFDVGGMFWIALDENDRVIGSVGYDPVIGSDEAWLHRLFVKFNRKREGIGSRLLKTAEDYARADGKRVLRVHLGERADWYESYSFYPKHGYSEYEPRYMQKDLL